MHLYAVLRPRRGRGLSQSPGYCCFLHNIVSRATRTQLADPLHLESVSCGSNNDKTGWLCGCTRTATRARNLRQQYVRLGEAQREKQVALKTVLAFREQIAERRSTL